jgi:hypothetical protein
VLEAEQKASFHFSNTNMYLFEAKAIGLCLMNSMVADLGFEFRVVEDKRIWHIIPCIIWDHT